MAVFRGPDDNEEEREEDHHSRPGAADDRSRFWWVAAQFLRRHRGKILGIIIGLWAGFGIRFLGLLWTLFISACVFVGYFVGRRLDENQEGLLEFLDRVLPPGRS